MDDNIYLVTWDCNGNHEFYHEVTWALFIKTNLFVLLMKELTVLHHEMMFRGGAVAGGASVNTHGARCCSGVRFDPMRFQRCPFQCRESTHWATDHLYCGNCHPDERFCTVGKQSSTKVVIQNYEWRFLILINNNSAYSTKYPTCGVSICVT